MALVDLRGREQEPEVRALLEPDPAWNIIGWSRGDTLVACAAWSASTVKRSPFAPSRRVTKPKRSACSRPSPTSRPRCGSSPMPTSRAAATSSAAGFRRRPTDPKAFDSYASHRSSRTGRQCSRLVARRRRNRDPRRLGTRDVRRPGRVVGGRSCARSVRGHGVTGPRALRRRHPRRQRPPRQACAWNDTHGTGCRRA